jgi:hypothetical protein
MDSILTRSFKCRSFLQIKDFLLRGHNPLGFQSCILRGRLHGASPLFRHGATGFRCKSSEKLYLDRKTKIVIADNEESDKFSTDDRRLDEEDFVESDAETDFSDEDASSSQDYWDDEASGTINDRDKARGNALHFPWLNGAKIPGKVVPSKVPGPIKYRLTKKETFFQFDYRNVDRVPITSPEMEDLLKKIELMLKDIELEAYGTSRGVETLRRNIDALPDSAKVRKMAVAKSKRSSAKLGDGFDKAVYVTSHGALRRAMFNLLYERHAIVTSGWTFNMKKLSPQLLGQSFLGPETRVVMDHQLAKDVIGELWMRGVSSKYNRLLKRHEDRFIERNFLRYLRPKSKEEVANMDWDTDLMLNSNEKIARQKPFPSTERWR